LRGLQRLDSATMSSVARSPDRTELACPEYARAMTRSNACCVCGQRKYRGAEALEGFGELYTDRRSTASSITSRPSSHERAACSALSLPARRADRRDREAGTRCCRLPAAPTSRRSLAQPSSGSAQPDATSKCGRFDVLLIAIV